MNQPLWGIDLGGTKIEGVILTSIDNAKPLVRTRIDTEADKGYEHIINQISNLVNELRNKSGLEPQTIGIGTPGVLDPVLQTMKNANTTSLNGKPLKKTWKQNCRCRFSCQRRQLFCAC
jgi:predicted NBD/HSP70 family sugar kinase